MRIEATGRDLVEHVGEARRIGRVRAAPPQLANGETQRIVEREQSNPSFAPASGALIAPVTFIVHPPYRPAGHFLIDAMLPGVDLRGEERQGLAFEALLAEKRRAFARRLPVCSGTGPAAEAHPPSSRRDRAAPWRTRSAVVMLPVRRASPDVTESGNHPSTQLSRSRPKPNPEPRAAHR